MANNFLLGFLLIAPVELGDFLHINFCTSCCWLQTLESSVLLDNLIASWLTNNASIGAVIPENHHMQKLCEDYVRGAPA